MRERKYRGIRRIDIETDIYDTYQISLFSDVMIQSNTIIDTFTVSRITITRVALVKIFEIKGQDSGTISIFGRMLSVHLDDTLNELIIR